MDIQKIAQKKQKPVDKMLKELGNELKRYREENNLIQVKMGEIAGVSYQGIKNIENGTIRNIELKKLIQIANSIGYTLELELKAVS